MTDEYGHNPPREATKADIEGDERLRRHSEPAEGGYGAEQEGDEMEAGSGSGSST